MPDTPPPTPLKKIRTFADDFAASKAKAEPDKNAAPAPTDAATSETKPVAPTAATPPAAKPETDAAPATSATGNPPFHALRNSSAEETTITPKKKASSQTTDRANSQESIAAVNKYAAGTIVEKKTRHTERDSILDDTDDDIFTIPSENDNEGDGSIVTDKKRTHPGFFKAVTVALRDWFKTQYTKLTTPKPVAPTHAVTKAETRKEQLEAAASASALAPREDKYVASQDTPEASEEPPSEKSFQITDAAKVSSPSWTHVKEAASEDVARVPKTEAAPEAASGATAAADDAAAEAGSAAPSSWSHSETAPEQNLPVAPEATAEPTPVSQSTSTPASVVRPQTNAQKPAWAIATADKTTSQTPGETKVTQHKETPTTPTPAPAVTETSSAPAPQPKPAAAPQPTEQTVPPEKNPAPTTKAAIQSDRTSRPWLPTVITVAVIVLAIGLGSASAWWLFGTDATNEVTEQRPVLSDIASDQQIAIPAAGDSSSTMNALSTASESAQSRITQLYLTETDTTGVVQPLSGETTFGALDWSAPGNFIRTVERVTLGTLNGTAPFIIIKVQSFDTALSGMIAWEATMSSDLAPWFGASVSQSFDPDARTVDQLRPAFFTDTLVDNRDVRLLRDELAEDRILYSFINRSTIIITTDREAFGELLSLVW